MGIHNEDRRYDGGGGGGGGCPTGSSSGGANEAVGHMYYSNVSSSRLGSEKFSTNSQPFDVFAAPYFTTTSYKSPERRMAASVAFPFTSVQWKELERQAMIYKYMVSYLPVPPHLLFPLSTNYPSSAGDSSSSLYNARYSRNGDLEPGRCKRTDGKKWRCSRDVAPHQKYCDRHLHRGRPRSRKPVELHAENNNKKTRLQQTDSLPNPTASQPFAEEKKPLLHFDPKTDLNISTAPSCCNRELGSMDGAEKQWERWAQANMGFTNEGCSIYGSASSLFHQEFVEQNPLNVSSYSNFPDINIEVAPSCFIDAYSCNNGTADSTKPENPPPPLKLWITMASGSSLDQEMARVNHCDEQQSIKDSRWLGSEPFARGGPLAEALGCKKRASVHSSPTGVLHQTMFSHSDGGSVCNSPTFAAAPTSEVAFRWLN